MNAIFAYCRAGFEADTAVEIQQKAADLGLFGYSKTQKNTGFVVFQFYQTGDADALLAKVSLNQMIFVRQWFGLSAMIEALPIEDRISPILEQLESLPTCGEVRVEYADTTSGRELSKFCRKFSVPLRQAMRGKGLLSKKANPSLPVFFCFFTATDQVFFGHVAVKNCSPHPLGVLRLKFPNKAPSRSTLKLDEAIHLFLTAEEQQTRLHSGMQAVDLGACPGGWSYQLVKRGMFVHAVDNGAMDTDLMESGQVTYHAADGFKFEPKKKNIDWLVCDMIEQPLRVAKLMATWLLKGWCRETIFNLKLPMKKRYECVQECLATIDEILKQQGAENYQLQVKHLYHNREEVTVHLRLR